MRAGGRGGAGRKEGGRVEVEADFFPRSFFVGGVDVGLVSDIVVVVVCSGGYWGGLYRWKEGRHQG